MSPRRWLIAATLAFAAAFALEAIARSRGDRRGLLVLVADGSASVRALRPSYVAWLAARLREHAAIAERDGWDVAWIAFDGDVRLLAAPRSASAFQDELDRSVAGIAELARPLESDVGGALELARDLLEARAGRVVLFSDRASTSGGVHAALAELRELGAPVEIASLPPLEQADLALDALDAAERVEAGAPVALRAHLRWRGPAEPPSSVELALEIASSSGRRSIRADASPVGARRVDGELVWAIRVELGPCEAGWLRVAARANSVDPIPSNDARELAIDCGGALRLAWVAARAPTEAWASASGLDARPLVANELAGALPSTDLVVIDGVDPRDLPVQALRAFLENGGSLLAWPSWSALPGWRVESAARDLLALAPRADARRELILLIDASGSMAGESMEQARGAAIELARRASDLDVAVCFFADRLGDFHALSAGDPVLREARARALLSAQPPRGATAIVGAIESLAERRASGGSPALAILLTDGRDERDASVDDARRARARLIASGAELAVIAVGAQPRLELLAALVPPGREVARADDASALSELLTRESGREDVREDRAIDVIAAEPPALEPASLARELAHAWSAAGALERVVRARALDEAAVLAASPLGEPVLGLRRIGLGASAALAFDPRWSVGDPTALAPTFRALARAAGDRRAREPRASWRGGDVELERVPADWPAAATATLHRPGERDALGTLELTPPTRGDGLDPRTLRRAAAPPDVLDDRAGEVLELRVDSKGWRSLIAVPARAEFDPAPPWPAALTAPTSSARGGPPTAPAARWALFAGFACGLAGAVGLAFGDGGRRGQGRAADGR